MTGSIELDSDGRTLRIRFPYDEALVQLARELPERRWDRAAKCWTAPATQVRAVVEAFMGFELAPEVSSLLAGTIVPTAAPKKPKAKPKRAASTSGAPATSADGDGLTVGAFNEAVKEALKGSFPHKVRVRGEVVGIDKCSGRKHLFFELVEKTSGADRPSARLDVTIFERKAQTLLPTLRAAGLELRDGVEILVEGRVDFYPASGRLSLIIDDIDPRFTLGQLALSREQILQKLREQELDRLNKSLALPEPAMRIGVLSSLDSDGWNDFRRSLETSAFGFQITAGDVRVQGRDLRPTMLAGLEWFADRAEQFDVLCIVRGGGSRTDLAWFDDEQVAVAVAKHPLKILCGIGHERDESVLDVISLGLKTPTAVAQLLIDTASDAARQLDEAAQRLSSTTRLILSRADQSLANAGTRFELATRGKIEAARNQLVATARQIRSSTVTTLTSSRARLVAGQSRLRAGGLASLRNVGTKLEHIQVSLTRAVRTSLSRRSEQLSGQQRRLTALDPERVLQRGYALVLDAQGAVVPDTTALRAGDAVQLRLRSGIADAEITATHPNSTEHGNAQEDHGS